MGDSVRIWKPVVGYEGFYEVSNYGDVRSLDRVIMRSNGRKQTLHGAELKKIEDKSGYLRVPLNVKGVEKHKFIHRIVAEAFLPNPLNLPEVNHNDEDKANNFVFINPDGSVNHEESNLEWCDRSYNCSYGLWSEKHIAQRRKKVIALKDGKKVKEYQSISDAARDMNEGKPITTGIMRVLQGKRKHYRGYEWQYA